MDNQPSLEELEAVFGAPKKEATELSKGQPTLEELHAAFGEPSKGGELSDIVEPISSFGAGMAKGVAGLANLPAVAQRGLLHLAEKGYLPKPEHPIMIPTVEEVTDIPALKQKPESTLGEYAQTIGEFTPGGGGVVRPIITGVTSEAAGQATKGTAAEPYARVAGALIGGGASGLPDYLTGPRGARAMVTRATEGATPEQINHAERLFNEARERGIDITRAEALDSVTQGATSLTDILRVLEGQGELRQFFAPRAGQVETAARREFENVAPELERPELIGPRAGEAARGEIVGAHAARSERTGPFYRQAAEQNVAHEDVSNAINRLDQLVTSDPTGATHGPLNELRRRLVATPARAGTPSTRIPVVDPQTGNIIRYDRTAAIPPTPERYVTDIESLDRIRKEFRDRSELPAFAERAIDKETASKINSLMDELNQAAIQRSVNLRLARRAHQEATRDIVEPLEAGPVGSLAKEGITTEQAQGALFPTNPLPGSEESLSRTIQALEGQEPNVARDLIRSHLERTFNEATQATQAGASQWGGAKFASVIAGNPQQRANLLTAINSLPNGPQITPGVVRLLDILEATGRRQAIGSKTAFNTPLIERLKSGIPADKAKVFSSFGKWLDDISVGRNTEELSRLLTDPAAARDFRNIAQGNDRSFIRGISGLAARTSRYAAEAAAREGQFGLDYDNRPTRATGGKVSRGFTVQGLLGAVEAAKKHNQQTTEKILGAPDEHVVHALKIANDHI